MTSNLSLMARVRAIVQIQKRATTFPWKNKPILWKMPVSTQRTCTVLDMDVMGSVWEIQTEMAFAMPPTPVMG